LLKNKGPMNKAILGGCCAALLILSACSRQQSDWEKTRAANTTESYEQFLKKYPSGEFTAQAQARVKELYEERDWQKARDTDTQDAYQAFLKQYPEGKWTEEARIRVENFSLAQATSGAPPGGADTANGSGNPAADAAAASPAAGAGGAAGRPQSAPSMAPAAKPQSPATATAAPPTKPVKPAKPTASASSTTSKGSYGIQLGAFKSGEAAAKKRWEHLKSQYPKLLAGLSPTVSPKTVASGTLYRLQAEGLSEKRAHSICKILKAKSQPCVPLPPALH
jgi:cell division septation protein DedD